jgi:hypothetical protein
MNGLIHAKTLARMTPSRFSRACAAPRSAFITISPGRYFAAYVAEMAWREDNRRVSNGEHYLMTASAALKHPVSRQWKGYWQRNAAE